MKKIFINSILSLLSVASVHAQLPADFYNYTPLVKLPYSDTALAKPYENGFSPNGWSAFGQQMTPYKVAKPLSLFTYNETMEATEIDMSKLDPKSTGLIFTDMLVTPPFIIPESGKLRITVDMAIEAEDLVIVDGTIGTYPYSVVNDQTMQSNRFDALNFGFMKDQRQWREKMGATCGDFFTLKDQRIYKFYPNKTDFTPGDTVCMSFFVRGGSAAGEQTGVWRIKNLHIYDGEQNIDDILTK